MWISEDLREHSQRYSSTDRPCAGRLTRCTQQSLWWVQFCLQVPSHLSLCPEFWLSRTFVLWSSQIYMSQTCIWPSKLLYKAQRKNSSPTQTLRDWLNTCQYPRAWSYRCCISSWVFLEFVSDNSWSNSIDRRETGGSSVLAESKIQALWLWAYIQMKASSWQPVPSTECGLGSASRLTVYQRRAEWHKWARKDLCLDFVLSPHCVAFRYINSL